MRPASPPPGLALWLLRRCLPAQLCESAIGDLEEERSARGSGRAWFWAQSLGIALAYVAGRGPRPSRPRARAQGDGHVESLLRNARHGARVLVRAPGFTLVAVLTLALGIGANTAIFSVVNALLIRPLPLPASDRLVQVVGLDKDARPQYLSMPDFEDLRGQARLFEGFTAFVPQSANLTGRAEPQRVRAGFVSDSFFDVVGVRPAIGRGFVAGVDDAEGAPLVCVLQHETWQGLFGGDAGLVGREIVLNNEPYTVVGIMPKGFRFPFDEVELWAPHHSWPHYRDELAKGKLALRTNGMVGPVARMRPGVRIEEARAELAAIASRLATQFPEGGEKRSLRATPLRDVIVSDVKQAVLVLLGAVGFVLLIASANVANLMLARAAGRAHELATRAALGAGRGRLASELLTEAGLLWLGGGALGLLLGWAGLRTLMASAPRDLPGGIVPQLDATVFLFTLAATALTGIAFGIIPALRFSSPNAAAMLGGGGRSGIAGGGRSRLRAALVVGQMALTLVLLVGAGLLTRSFGKLAKVDVGFRSEGLLTMEYRLPQNKYPEGPQQWHTHRQIIERVRAVPGVVSAALVRGLPFSGNGGSAPIEVVGQPTPEKPPRARTNTVDPAYFETMGIPLLRGRVFTDRDAAGAPPVVIVSRALAELHWPGADPVGRQIGFPGQTPPLPPAEIVGVVGDTKQYGLDETALGFVYVPQAQNPHIFNTLAVRTAGDPMPLAGAVRSAVWSVDPEQPVWKVRTQQSLVEQAKGMPRFLAQLMGGYAALALLLAAVGLYGVTSYAVTQRTREIGLRMALGAEPADVLRIVLRRGFVLASIGLAIGLVGALALGRVIGTLLYATSPADTFTLVSVALLLMLVAGLASYLPARRATRVDPTVALRYD
jgi:putative ABC transport system permease protein